MAGCTGTIDAGVSAPGPREVTAPTAERACGTGIRAITSESRRLTSSELVASFERLFGARQLEEPAIAGAISLLGEESLDAVGTDFNPGYRSRAPYFQFLRTAVEASFQRPSGLEVLLPGCDPARADTCRAALTSLLSRAYRRTPTDAEVAGVQALADEIGGGLGIQAAVLRILASPHFTEQLELGASMERGRVRLTDSEVAARVAFMLTAAPPDPALAEAAGQGFTLESLREQGERLLESDLGRAHVRRTSRNWLKIASVPDPDARVAAHAMIDPDGLGAEAEDEFYRFLEHLVFEERGSFADLYRSGMSFPETDRLRAIFESASGDFAHRGLLRPAALISSSSLPSAVGRGLFVRRQLLCGNIGEPNDDAVEERLEEAGELEASAHSQREILAEQTSPASCAGCHAQINPLGFVLGGYDTLGRAQSEERVLDADGQLVASHRIDATVSDLQIGDEPTSATGAGDLAAALASSIDAQRCLTSQFLIHNRHRNLDTGDGCLLEELDEAVADGASIYDVFLGSVVNEDVFYRAAE
ncbi:MAG: DUF1588 domain-containing protein [Myxococcota bacterium]